jgi:hypothetical protein
VDRPFWSSMRRLNLSKCVDLFPFLVFNTSAYMSDASQYLNLHFSIWKHTTRMWSESWSAFPNLKNHLLLVHQL